MDEAAGADFELEPKSVGLGTKIAMKIFDKVQNGLIKALKTCTGRRKKDFAQACEIADKTQKGFKCRKL